MSADKLNGRVTVYKDDTGVRYYSVDTERGRVMIGAAPGSWERYADDAADACAAVLLTSMPRFAGAVGALADVNKDIPIYASAAGLRNIKEIINREVNERLIKDGMAPEELGGIAFTVTPGVSWMDSVTAVYDGVLFSGELFSGFDGGWDGFDAYYHDRLSVHGGFVRSALEKLKKEDIHTICPAAGEPITSGDVDKAFKRYYELTAPEKREKKRALILCASAYGYTRTMAEHAEALLSKSCETELLDVYAEPAKKLRAAADAADILLIGTHTINRNAPREIWDAVTSLDLVNKRGMPYLVFGSFGWAGDGIKLIDKTLSAMGMRQAAKPVEALFRPAKKDIERLEKAVARLTEEK